MAEGCSNWKKKTAKEGMEIGDCPAPILYSDVLRQAKNEFIDRELGVKKLDGRDIIRTIEDIRTTSPYIGSIQAIGSYKFFVMYRSPNQMQNYKEFCRYIKGNAKVRPLVFIVRSYN